MQKQYVEQTKHTILDRSRSLCKHKDLKNLRKQTRANPNDHKHQLQGEMIGLHFTQDTVKCTKDFNIKVLEFISLPQNSERALTLGSKRRNSGYIGSDANPTRASHHGVNTKGIAFRLRHHFIIHWQNYKL